MSLDYINSKLDTERAWRHLAWIEENAPSRINGCGDDQKAADYFAEQFDSYGLESRVDQFQTFVSIPGASELSVLSPESLRIPSESCGHIRSTPPGGLEATLIDVGFGEESAYNGHDVRESIILTDITSGPSRPEKARIAADRGAVGIVFSNMGPVELPNIPMGAIKSVWGNPTRRTFEEIPALSAVGITRADGDRLRELCRSNRVSVRLTAEAESKWDRLPQPQARLQGGRNHNGDVIVVAGHFDAWYPGMSDNAAGNALILELARTFQAVQDDLERDIIFAMWNGHEIGEIAGSTWFLDTNWDELDEHGITYFNIDSVGFKGTSYFETSSNPELVRFHQSVEQEILGKPCSRKRLTRGNEQPFFPLGMPALEGSYKFSEEQIAAWDNASGGWWWHSSADTSDKISPDRFLETARLYAGYIEKMATEPILPMDYATVARELEQRIQKVAQNGGRRFRLDLPVAEFVAAAKRFDALIFEDRHRDRIDLDRLNRVQKRLGRLLLPAFETFGGRYEQDRVGHPALKSPLPALHDLEASLGCPDSEDRHNLLMTELLRGRNRMSDALRTSTHLIDDVC